MTPQCKAPRAGALGKATSETGFDSSPLHSKAQRLPADLRFSGVLLDAEHLDAADSLASCTKSESALSAIALWRKHSERMPFLVVAGELHRPQGRVVGGLAGSWSHAVGLLALAMARFCEIAETECADFSSAWLMFLSEPRQAEVRALMAQAQQVGGRA